MIINDENIFDQVYDLIDLSFPYLLFYTNPEKAIKEDGEIKRHYQNNIIDINNSQNVKIIFENLIDMILKHQETKRIENEKTKIRNDKGCLHYYYKCSII